VNSQRYQRKEQADPGDDYVAAPSPEYVASFVVLYNRVQPDLSAKAIYSSSTHRPCSVTAELEASSMAGS